uniref:hypothetical protein n=1 Tax=Lactobacillus acidophilus TaxID=1579 RepID=UPI003F557A98
MEQIFLGIKQDNGSIKMFDSFTPVDMSKIHTTYLPKYDLDETESIRRYWRWRGCKKWQDDFFDALDDYGEIQKRRIKLSKTPKRPFEIDDKFNVLKESY